jgi:hypothetical protein
MGIPGTGGQLLILVLFILPGSVFQASRSRLRGPNPADQDATSRILRALAVSTGLNALYLAILGEKLLGPLQARSVSALDRVVDARLAGCWALALLFAVPMLLAGLDYWRTRWEWVEKARRAMPGLRLAYDPTPRAWDYAFTDISPCYVRVQSADGRWAGGWFAEGSFAASYPEPLELYIEEAFLMGEDGTFMCPQPGSRGMYVRCDDARVVEFLAGGEAAGEPEGDAYDEPSRGNRDGD